jgi:hypothetical protein
LIAWKFGRASLTVFAEPPERAGAGAGVGTAGCDQCCVLVVCVECMCVCGVYVFDMRLHAVNDKSCSERPNIVSPTTSVYLMNIFVAGLLVGLGGSALDRAAP